MTDPKHWQVLARRSVYENAWIDMQFVDIRLSDGQVLRDIHLVGYKHAAAAVVPVADDGKILLIDHYRFQTDTRGWEISAGEMARF